ncbi:unnamed protein product [Rotaria sp. Silwood1]|nr:unnamed protein product [Rotaria sp. Silwood1]
MNLLNIAKHLLDLAQTEFGYENSAMTTGEIFIVERLFEVLKSFKDSYFSELYTYDSLEFEDEYDETTEEEDNSGETIDEAKSDDEMDDYNENEHSDLRNRFTLDEMEKIIEWVDQHPNARFATLSHRFKKVKHRNSITRFREYIENNGTRIEKLKQIKEFMLNEFYLQRTIEKAAVHDTDLELYAIQKARELNWDTFKASKQFLNTFKKENRISSRRYDKIITRTISNSKICSLDDAQNWIESKRTIISKYTTHQILNSDHCSFQQEYVSPRTLSFSGERRTEVVVKKKHHLTHSYTVQRVTSADGCLLGKFFLILQEKGNEFGKTVQKYLIVPPNVVVGASKSGKSSGSCGNSSSQLCYPYNLIHDSSTGTLYIADTINHRVVRYLGGALSGTVVSGGNGAGFNNNQLNYPIDLYFESSSNSLMIANAGANIIVRWTIGASNWTLIAGNSNGTIGSTLTMFYYPVTVIFDSYGNIYVTDTYNHRIQFFSSGSQTGTTIAGVVGTQRHNDTLLKYPYFVILDNNLNLYVADNGNHRIQKFLRY